jgi:hypothetical protein
MSTGGQRSQKVERVGENRHLGGRMEFLNKPIKKLYIVSKTITATFHHHLTMGIGREQKVNSGNSNSSSSQKPKSD